MTLEGLLECINTLKERIEKHKDKLQLKEAGTRASLIDPLLCALGWAVSDPTAVEPEYSVGKVRADYALLRSHPTPVAIIEAKKLGSELSHDQRMQMLNYANAYGISYAALTDGNRWEVYDVFKASPLEEKKVLQITLSETPVHESALRLLLLWRTNLSTGKPILPPRPITENEPVITPPNPPPKPDNWRSISDFVPVAKSPCAKRIRFWDGEERSLGKYWREVLLVTANQLHRKGLLNSENMPVFLASKRSTAKKYIANSTPQHSDGKPFLSPKKVHETEFFVDCHHPAKGLLTGTKALLKHCGISAGDVSLLL